MQTKNLLVAFLTALVIPLGITSAQADTCVPEDAVILFDGNDLSQWTKEDGGPAEWKIVDGAMEVIPGKGSIMTKQNFQDCRLHLEFMLPETPADANDQDRANSGVYIQRRYEVQILDSFGLQPQINGCGAIYRVKAPDKNLCKPPGMWQTYDIFFRAARFEGNGESSKKVEDARITVLHNGVVIHNNVRIPNKTGAGKPETPHAAPILLQDHGSPIRFRNVWAVPLD